MWVVKLGGSLLNSSCLKQWLGIIAEHGVGRVVIVPGGGIFADQVRKAQVRWQFGDATAHRMALRAMEQFGLLLQGMKAGLIPARSETDINNTLNSNHVPIWFPYEMVAGNPEIAASWDITSDSLGLWLAEKLGCKQLVLVKSTVPENGNYAAEFLSQQGYLDNAFTEMLGGSFVKTWWLSHEELEKFSDLLSKGTSLDNHSISLN